MFTHKKNSTFLWLPWDVYKKKKNTKQKQAAIITSTHPDFSESKFFYPPIGGIGRHSSKFKALKKKP